MTALVYIYLAWSAAAKYFSDFGVIGQFLNGLIALIPLLLLADIVIYRGEGLLPHDTRRIIWAIMTVVALSGLSLLFNGSPIINAVKFLYSILRVMVIFFWIIVSRKSEEISRFTLGFVQFLAVLQIPFFIFGFITKGGTYVGDNAMGAVVTGGAYEVATYMFFGILAAIGFYQARKAKIYAAYAVGCLIILLVTSTKQIALLTPFIVFFILYRFERIKIVKSVILVLVVGALFDFGYRLAEFQWGQVIGEMAGPSEYVEPTPFLDMLTTTEKAQGYYDAFVTVPSQLPVPMLGAGPGNYASYTAMNARTPLAETYINSYLATIPEGMFGTMVSRTSGIISIYGDIGPIGLLILIYIYWSVFRLVGQRGWRWLDAHSRAMAFIAVGAGLLLLAESVLLNVFEGNSILLNLFWISSATIIGRFQDLTEGRDSSSLLNRRFVPEQ